MSADPTRTLPANEAVAGVGSDAPENRSIFGSDRDGDTGVEPEYRRINLWALAAFVTGLLSVLAFIGPLLWIVPAAALAFGVLALRAIKNQPDVFTGVKLAVTGMALATILLSSILAHNFAHTRIVTGYGQLYGQRWLKMLGEKRFAEAYQLRQSHQNRPSEGTNLIDLYTSGPIKEFFDAFMQEDVPKRLSAMGDDAAITFLNSRFISRDSLTIDVVGLRYRVDSKAGSTKPFVVEVELAREFFASTNEGRWNVRRAVVIADAL